MQFLRNIWRHPFWRSVATLLSGSVAAQAISLGILPVLGWLYEDTAFGAQGVFVALIHTLVIACNGGYEQAIMLPKESAKAKSLLELSLLINLIFCMVVAGALFALSPWIWNRLSAPELTAIWGLVILSLWLEGNIQALRIMLNRLQAYKALSVIRVIQSITAGGSMIGFGYMGWGMQGLLIGWTLGQVVTCLGMAFTYWPRRPDARFSIAALKELAYEYRDFPTHAVGAGWLNSFSRQLPFFLLPSFFGLGVNGYFFMAHRALMLPMSLVSRSIGEVFYRQATHATQPQDLKALTDRMARQLALMALPVLIIVMAAGPWIAEFILGEEWRLAGIFGRWMMPWLYLMFITSPLTYILDIQRRLDFQLKYNIALFLIRLGALLLGGYLFDATQTLMLYAGMGAVMVGIHLRYLIKIAGEPTPSISASSS